MSVVELFDRQSRHLVQAGNRKVLYAVALLPDSVFNYDETLLVVSSLAISVLLFAERSDSQARKHHLLSKGGKSPLPLVPSTA